MNPLILVHGSGTGPWIFDGWEDTFGDRSLCAVDLQVDLDVATASIADYAENVLRATRRHERPVVVGWSLGGLVAMLAAQTLAPEALVLLEPSPPLEVQGRRDVAVRDGTFDPEEAGARFPPGIRKRPESARVMGQRDRGVSVPFVRCPALVVFGDLLRHDRGEVLAERYGATALHLPGATHWDLVREPGARSRVAEWLDSLCRAATT